MITDQATKLKYFASNYFFPSYDIKVDKELFITLFQMMYNNLLQQYHPDILQNLVKTILLLYLQMSYLIILFLLAKINFIIF